MVTASTSELRDLFDRLSQALDRERGLHLSVDDLDLLVVSGAYAHLSETVARSLQKRAIAKLEARARNVDTMVPDHTPAGDGRPSDDLGFATVFEPPAAKVPDVFTPASLAEHWGCSREHVSRLIRSGTLRSFRIGKMYRIRRDAVEAYQAGPGAMAIEGD